MSSGKIKHINATVGENLMYHFETNPILRTLLVSRQTKLEWIIKKTDEVRNMLYEDMLVGTTTFCMCRKYKYIFSRNNSWLSEDVWYPV